VKKLGILATLVAVPAGLLLSELTYTTTLIADSNSYHFIGGRGGDAY